MPSRLAIWAMLAAAPAVMLGSAMARGLRLPALDDEAVHILGGQYLAAGGVLYRDFIDSHGPLMFVAAQAYGALFGWHWPNGVRLVPIAATLLAGVFVARSTLLADAVARWLAVFVLAALLAASWLHQGLFTFNYYPIAGALASIVLAGFVLPAIAVRRIAAPHAFGAGMAAMGLIAAAYSFGPSVVAFAAAGLWRALARGQRRGALWFSAGAALGLGMLLAWLIGRADWRGYLAFHFAESQFYYARDVGFTLGHFLASFAPGISPPSRMHALAVLWFVVAAAALFAAAPAGERAALALMLAGIVALDARGDVAFKDATFLIAAAAACALGLGQCCSTGSRSSRTAVLIVALAVAIVTALGATGADYTPYGATRAMMALAPVRTLGHRDSTPAARSIRALIGPGERMLVLTYNPELYLQADRLPMPGFYTWFAWDEQYARGPGWFGRPRSLCAALANRPPPLLVIGPWPPGWIAPQSHIACLPAVLAGSYVRLAPIPDFAGTLFLRRDRVRQDGAPQKRPA